MNEKEINKMIILKSEKCILILTIITLIKINYLISGNNDQNNILDEEQYLQYIDDEQYEDELIDLSKPIPVYENIQFTNMFPNIQDLFSVSTSQEEDSMNTVQQMTIAGTNMSNEITYITEKPVQSIYRVPQSFTIFMNFQNDGTTSMQVLNEHNLYWSDLGVCRHGQRYDSSTGICRDVFCVEGFILSANGCIPDENYNKSSSLNKPIKPPPAEMKIEIKLSHKLCFYIKNINDTLECKHDLVMIPNDEFLNNLKLNLSKILEIDNDRIKNLKLVEHMIVNEPIIPLITTRLNQTNTNLNDSLNQIIKTEHLKISFEVKDKQLFSNDKKESILLFYYLNLLAMNQHYNHLLIKNHQISISEVNDLTSISSDHGWCNENGEEKLYIRNDFHIYASFDKNNTPTYYVYVNETETLYGTGNFYLTVLIIPNIRPLESKTTSFKNYLNEWSPGLNDITDTKTVLSLLTDVTELMLEPNTSSALTNKLLIVCNRRPKIKVECENFKTIQLRLCELIKMKDRSYCSYDNKKCFNINEYEYDDLEPNRYIRVCEHSIKNMTNFYKEQIKSIKQSLNIGSLVQAWLSVGTSILSLIGLLLVLITYLLFDELRNIPGWNLINLTIALIIAQSSFLAGSFFNDIDTFCFIISLTTHYGYLASFFWMNVIAFDLFRNFRDKSSHILINTIRIRSRISKYALYGWLSPLVIVASGVLVDIFLKDGQLERFKPCYAGYLCKNKFYFDLNNKNISLALNMTNFNLTTCFSGIKEYPLILLSKTCWIRNGNSNLIFFGLPLAIFIIINCVYYILTICNIRKMKRKQKQSHLRRFSRNKLPGDEDVKFYIRMALILGFTWITGFIMTTFSLTNEIVYQIFIYVFILSNCLCGVFIFFSFVFKKETKKLYKEFLNEKIFVRYRNGAMNNNRVSFIRSVTMPKERAISESSTTRLFTPIFYRFNLYTIQEKIGRFKKQDNTSSVIPIKNSSISTISTENDRIKF